MASVRRKSEPDRAPQGASERARPEGRAVLTLHVVHGGRTATFPLDPARATVVGRSADADVRIDEPAVSRRHLSLEIDMGPHGPEVVAQDLGSMNGVKLGAITLTRGERTKLEPGTVIEIGTALLVFQRTVEVAAPRRVWSHDYFEGRLEDECARAERGERGFALLRLRVPAADEPTALDALSIGLHEVDVVAVYGPGELEAILLDRTDPAAEARRLTKRLLADLAADGVSGTMGVAIFPTDGRTGDLLMGIAAERLSATGERRGPRTLLGRQMATLEQVLKHVAPGDLDILVTGEKGTGKSMVAEAIHRLSPRADKAIVRVDCATLTEERLAGGGRGKGGLFDGVDGGTLFLDAVDELPLSLQGKLLRVLEGRRLARGESRAARALDIRVVSATNRDLAALAAQGGFRSDLLVALSGFTTMTLPLRARRDEIRDIARGLLAEAAAKAGVAPPVVDDAVLAALESYAWPGNVRELRNVLDRAWLLAGRGRIGLEHLPADKLAARFAAPSQARMPAAREVTPSRAPKARPRKAAE